MTTGPILGIDLGTTNSVVAVADGSEVRVLADGDGRKLVPSVVAFHPSGGILVGHGARERRLLDAKNTVYSTKRLIGRPFASEEVRRARERFAFELREGPTGGTVAAVRAETYTLPEISAFVLREVRSLAEKALGAECTRAIVTVPANFNELQRSATKAAGRIAGLDVVRILNEPTAAALAHGYGRGARERIAIYDMGGGTFDMTILDLAGDVFEVIATAGDTFLGGDDIDVIVADAMSKAFLAHHRYDPKSDAQAYERLRAAAEWAKCQLSTEEEVQLRVEELAYGTDGVALDLAFGLTRAALERMIQPLIARSFDVCEDAMRVASIRPSSLDNVILVGGSTRMPLVRQMVAEYFGRDPLAHIDPDLVVAQGAAIQAYALAGPSERSWKLGRVQLKRITQVELESARRATSPGEPERRPKGPAFMPISESLPLPPPPPVPHGVVMPDAVSDEEPTGVKRSPYADAPAPAGLAGAQALARATGPGRSLPSRPASKPASARPGAIAMPHRAPPLLLDVTPHSLGIETVAGYCETVIRRNAAIPVEQTRIFTTSGDGQTIVRVQICQGESRRLDDNQRLGEIELTGIRAAPRGAVKISVTFVLDADGTLGVRARDTETGREQTIRVHLVGGLGEADVQRMRARQSALPPRA